MSQVVLRAGHSQWGWLRETILRSFLAPQRGCRRRASSRASVLGQTGPVVGGAAGLHQNGRGRLQGEEAGELTSAQTLSLADPAGLARDRNFEDGLCQIHGDRRRMLHGLLLSERAAMTPNHVGTL